MIEFIFSTWPFIMLAFKNIGIPISVLLFVFGKKVHRKKVHEKTSTVGKKVHESRKIGPQCLAVSPPSKRS